MVHFLRQWLSASTLMLVATSVAASFHAFAIEQVYSNADGTVQFIVLHEAMGAADANLWSGHALTSTHAGVAKTFPFGTDLPSAATAGKRVLVGTNGLAALGFITPDYVMPDGFLATDGVVIDYAGVDQVTFASLPTDGVNALGRSGAPMPNLATNFAGAAVALPALSVAAIEYYNASLDHYFISTLQPDIDALDTGRTAGWARTGETFRVYPSQASGGAGVSPVCRFYIPPQHGNSHFFSASPAECALIQQKAATDANYSGSVFESPSVFYIGLPDTSTGACPDGTESVYCACGTSAPIPITAIRAILQ